MNITLASASALVDQFEQLLAVHSISVPKNPQTGADMLPLWQLLQTIRNGALQSSQPDRHRYAAALAAHDLAAKVMEVRNSPQFPKLLPHLHILAGGAVHLTQDPPPQSMVHFHSIQVDLGNCSRSWSRSSRPTPRTHPQAPARRTSFERDGTSHGERCCVDTAPDALPVCDPFGNARPNGSQAMSRMPPKKRCPETKAAPLDDKDEIAKRLSALGRVTVRLRG